LRSVLGSLSPIHVAALPGECADVDTPADLQVLGDRAAMPVESLIKRLDVADAQPGAAEVRTRTYDLLATGEVVDVGCGSGRAVAELGEGALGVDPSEEMLTAARTRWPGRDFRTGDAYELPLADASMRGYRADKVFHLLTEPAQALAEARRVLRAGGRIVLTGQDWDALIIDSDDPARTRELVRARAAKITDPRAARRSRAWLLDAGFVDVTVEVHAVVFTDEAALPLLTTLAAAAPGSDDWLAEQAGRARANRLFVAVPIIITAATRP
jgi:ubiquinone/menaquinone biosynthesis C-methylase UbiE